MGAIHLKNIGKRFAAMRALSDVTLEIQHGEFVVFVGPSGCGKSTLLRLIAGLEDASEGAIEIDRRDVTRMPPAKRGLSMVFQSYALYPHMSVRNNIAFPLKMAGESRESIDNKVAAAAEVLNLTDYLDRRPRQLSGGQRQRVAIGRAIVREPKAFLFDEPLSNLDAALRVHMRMEIAQLHRRLKTTMIYVTHDQTEAMTLADKIAVMRAGRIEQFGEPLQLYRRPKNRFVAGFIGSPAMNFFDGEAARAFGAHTIGVRPEHWTLSIVDDASPAADNASNKSWRGVADMIEHLGSDTFVHVAIDKIGRAVARVDGETAIARGARVQLVAQVIHKFDKNGLAI